MMQYGCSSTLESGSTLYLKFNRDFEITSPTYIDIVHVSAKENTGTGLYREPPVLTKEFDLIADSFATVYLDWENAPDRDYALERFVFRLHGFNDSLYISRPKFLTGGRSLLWEPLMSKQVKQDVTSCLQGTFISEETRERWGFYGSEFSAYLRDERENTVYCEGVFKIKKENTIELQYSQFVVDDIEQSVPTQTDHLNCNCSPDGVIINNQYYARQIR